MFKFFFKKNFFDVWDNLFYIIICNFMFLLVLAAAYLVYKIAFVFEFISCILLCVTYLALGENAAKIAGFDTPHYKVFFKNLGKCLVDGVFLGLFVGMLFAVARISMPYYYRMWIPADGSQGNFLYAFFLVFIFWFLVITLLALQWFLPVRSLMHDKFGKCLKKSYILFFDNIGFTFGVGLVNLLNLVVTAVTFGLVPGASGIALTCTNALRLRLYKYDWLEVNPDLSREEIKNVPWGELILRDKTTFGNRSLKNLFFPWRQ